MIEANQMNTDAVYRPLPARAGCKSKRRSFSAAVPASWECVQKTPQHATDRYQMARRCALVETPKRPRPSCTRLLKLELSTEDAQAALAN